MIFAAGLLVDAVQNLPELGWLPLATHPIWHTGNILNEDTAVGDLARSFFGYAQIRPSCRRAFTCSISLWR